MMGKDYEGPERRRYRRINRKLVIRLQVYPEKKVMPKGGHDIVSVNNISAGGILFSYGKELDKGKFVDLQINFPELNEPVRCLGKVVRVEPPGESKAGGQMPLYYIAVRFIQTRDKSEEDMISGVIEKYHAMDTFEKG